MRAACTTASAGVRRRMVQGAPPCQLCRHSPQKAWPQAAHVPSESGGGLPVAKRRVKSSRVGGPRRTTGVLFLLPPGDAAPAASTASGGGGGSALKAASMTDDQAEARGLRRPDPDPEALAAADAAAEAWSPAAGSSTPAGGGSARPMAALAAAEAATSSAEGLEANSWRSAVRRSGTSSPNCEATRAGGLRDGLTTRAGAQSLSSRSKNGSLQEHEHKRTSRGDQAKEQKRVGKVA